jgi:hypothetical protein
MPLTGTPLAGVIHTSCAAVVHLHLPLVGIAAGGDKQQDRRQQQRGDRM